VNDLEYSLLKRKILNLLRIDIDAYKSTQMRRRIESFVGRQGASSVADFLRRIGNDEDLLARLRDMLTINVSEFFRDAKQWDHLASVILPDLLERSPTLNVWSAGCSRGQEPYSLAIILAEMNALHRSRILATDLDPEALQRAREGGPYPAAEVKNMPPNARSKCFTESPDGITVTEQIRRRIEFRQHNLLSDSFETGFDLIVCRNVTIYFSGEVKTKLMGRFRRSLKPQGVLFVGGTEALLGEEASQFRRVFGNFYRQEADAVTRRFAAGLAGPKGG
jgi:chemotaxis protein methyltransferase CheR